MKRIARWLLPVIVVVALVGGLAFRNQNNQTKDNTDKNETTQNQVAQNQEYPAETFIAPNFTLQTLDGKSVTLSQLRGKPTFVNFWNSWCPPCKAEMPDLVKEYNVYKGTVQFLGVNLTTNNDSVEGAKGFVQNFQVPYPILIDSSGIVGEKYNVSAVPTSMFIDKNGKIIHMIQGMMDKATMDSYFKELSSK